MNKKGFLTLIVAILITVGIFAINLPAQNRQNYTMDNVQAEHYIKISREEIDKNNLPLARVYAQKAIQANAWSKKAWANYNDIIQKLADEGEIKEFDTFIEESTDNTAPTAGGSGSKFEGC